MRCSNKWKGRLREESKITSLVWTSESLVNSVTKIWIRKEADGKQPKLPSQNAGRNVNLGSRENLDNMWKYQQSKHPQGSQGSDGTRDSFKRIRKRLKVNIRERKFLHLGPFWLFPGERIRLALYCFQQRAGFRLQAFMLAKIFSLFLFVCIQGFPFQFLKNILINQNIK